MERRVVIWLISSAIFLLLYISLRQVFGPPPQPNPPVAEAEADPQGDEEERGIAEGNDAPGEPAAESSEESAPEWSTLGSMDPESGYSMLVTLTNQGGAIERIELTARDKYGQLRYRRTDLDSGYLGYLAADADPAGCLINVVGPGTPAALAQGPEGLVGLRPGDRITHLNGVAVVTPADLDEVLRKTKPGDTLKIRLVRPAVPAADQQDEAGEAGGGQKLQFQTELTRHPLDLVRLAKRAGPDQIPGNLSRPSCLLGLSQLGDRELMAGQTELGGLPTQHASHWNVAAKKEATIEYRLPLSGDIVAEAGGAGALELVRRYRLRPSDDPSGGFVIDMDVEVRNNADAPQRVAYRLEGPNGITLEGWWYSTKISPNFGGAGARDVIYNSAADAHELISTADILEQAEENPQDPDLGIFSPRSSDAQRTLRYIGVDAQYFTVAYLPPQEQPTLTTLDRANARLIADPDDIPTNQERAANTSFAVQSRPIDVPAGGALQQSFQMYAGPKDADLLATYGLDPAIEYGWFPLIAKPLGGILHFFNSLTGNYAIAIILLTLLVRGALFPLGRKAAQNAQKMQELAPEFKKIAEKYKNDMEKRMTAQRELQKKHGFNPLAGCAPLLIQFPIFIGLYRCLSVDIELRQAPFASWLRWCDNLAAPDMLAYWANWMPEYFSGRGTGWLGPYFNILPLIVVALFMLQQKMFMPPATDEQTAMTQKVMTVMTLFMGLFFFRVASGLCVYFITSSLWGMAERMLVKRTVGATPGGGNGSTLPRPERPNRPKPTPQPKERDRPVQRRPKPGAKATSKKGGKRRK